MKTGFPAAILAALLFVTVPGEALAISTVTGWQKATITFDTVANGLAGGATTYAEHPVIVTGLLGSLGYYDTPGRIHLDDFGTPFTSAVAVEVPDILAVGGKEVFRPLSFAIHPVGTFHDRPYNNIRVLGYYGGRVVAEDTFMQGNYSYRFDDTFGVPFLLPHASVRHVVDRLVIMALTSPGCTGAPCAHFDIDDLRVEYIDAIPLPAGLPLLVSGLLVLAAAARSRPGATGR